MVQTVSIQLPPPTKDQQEYLEGLRQSHEFDKIVAKRCTCKIGGRGPKHNDPPCPVHGVKHFGQVQFDAEFPPDNIQNKIAAKERNWKYDEKRDIYRDSDGSVVADRFGQPY